MEKSIKERMYLKYPNCLISDGYLRSVIIDTQRNKYLFIPNDIVEIIEKRTFDISDLNHLYGNELEYLVNNELIFQVDSKIAESFPIFNTKYESPSVIENSIVDLKEFKLKKIKSTIYQLEKLLCKSVQFRFFKIPQLKFFYLLMDIINESSIESIEIVMPLIDGLDHTKVQSLILKECKKVTLFFIFSAKENNSIFFQGTRIIFNTDRYLPYETCGNINLSLFTVNVSYISLSHSYNTCLYKKISIDTDGNIKNCPSCSKSFGNIKDTTLEQALSHPEFKKHWNITKDQIDVCKDCEFRHMCTDCRVFIKDSENPYSQPSKCTYNPYIAKWKGEEGYVPVEECGTYTRETGFVVNTRRVAELNNQIWGE